MWNAKSNLTVFFKKMEIALLSIIHILSSSRATVSVPRTGQPWSMLAGFSTDPKGPCNSQSLGKGPYLWIRAAESFSRFRLFLSA